MYVYVYMCILIHTYVYVYMCILNDAVALGDCLDRGHGLVSLVSKET
jgi:hypothetical protein